MLERVWTHVRKLCSYSFLFLKHSGNKLVAANKNRNAHHKTPTETEQILRLVGFDMICFQVSKISSNANHFLTHLTLPQPTL